MKFMIWKTGRYVDTATGAEFGATVVVNGWRKLLASWLLAESQNTGRALLLLTVFAVGCTLLVISLLGAAMSFGL